MTVEIKEKRTQQTQGCENDIICRIKIDPLTFNDVLDLKIFRDWMAQLDYNFDWYKFAEESKIQFARMKLTRSGRIYWTSVESTEGMGLLQSIRRK